MYRLNKRNTMFFVIVAFSLVLFISSQVMADSQITQIRETLFKTSEDSRYGLRINENDASLQAIAKLQEIGTPEAVAVLEEFLTTYGKDRKLKQKALVALGNIGTQEAVAAIRRFESWAEKTRLDPPKFNFGEKDYAIDHFAPYSFKPLTTCQMEDGKTWALFRWPRFGDSGLWLTEMQDEVCSEPILVDLDTMIDFSRDVQFDLAGKDGNLLLKIDNLKITPGYLKTDRDRDGLTDIVENALGTSIFSSDTDQDGTPDGKDGNPLTPKHEQSTDETEIRQAVFSVLFATCNSQDAIVMVQNGDFANQEYYGYGGPILRATDRRNGFVNIMELKVDITSPTTATAEITDWEGMSAASGHVAELKKVHDKWVVTEFKMTWIS